ncbi:MAG TPA: hypothetical protein VG474_01585 [Solirubrobacteraceae bacterium]|nr:hypothetical protein [Solirubrobacteraceae bacterium]
MGFLRRRRRTPPGEYPEQFTRAFVRLTLPTATPAEARRTVEHLRGKGWSEDKLAEYVLPYMPRDEGRAQPQGAAGGGPEAVSVPAQVSRAWLDERLPAMTPRQMRLVVEELERRGWSARDAALAVLPHLLPKLPEDDAQAILAGLGELGVSDDEAARLGRDR